MGHVPLKSSLLDRETICKSYKILYAKKLVLIDLIDVPLMTALGRVI